jgi:hypothetical protein
MKPPLYTADLKTKGIPLHTTNHHEDKREGKRLEEFKCTLWIN